jgi:hypothetical protein
MAVRRLHERTVRLNPTERFKTMTKYVFAYHGGSMPESAEEQAEVMADWEGWFGTIGASIVDGGNPTGQSVTVNADGSTSDGGGANPISGYTLVNADSISAAADLAKGCPILTNGGSVEVAEAIDM